MSFHLREAQERIAAEERAIEQTAQITEERKAHVAARAFTVAAKMIERANDIMEKHPTSSARLLATGVATVQAIGGTATGYQVSAPRLIVQTSFVDEYGNPAEPPPPIQSIEQAESVIAEYEEKNYKNRPIDVKALEWEDVPAESYPAPVVFMRDENPDYVPGPVVPSRMDKMPTSDRRGARR